MGAVMNAEFVGGAFGRHPCFFDALPVAFPPETFDLDRLAGVLARMPRWGVLYRHGDGVPGGTMVALGDTDFFGGLARRLQAESIHINMLSLHEHDALIAEALRRFLHAVQAAGIAARDIRRPTAALFLSSPRACTHYHFDREQNFLLHVQGTKTIHVFPPRRPAFLTEITRACFQRGRRIHHEYREDLERQAQVFPLTPGTAIHIPRLSPHWVDNGAEISVSLSLNFFTPADMRRERFYVANERVQRVLERLARGAGSRRVAGKA